MATKKSTTKAKTKTTRTKAKTTKKPTTKKTTKTKAAASSKGKATNKQVTQTTKKNTKTVKTQTTTTLQKIHVFGALLCVTLAGLLFAYGNDLTVGIYTTYLAENLLTGTGELLPALRELFQVNLTYVAAGVLAAAGLWRIALATRLKQTHESQIDKRFTSLNWIEYSLFGPWVVGILAATLGVRDAMTLVLIGGVVALTGVFGYIADRYTMLAKRSWLKTKIAIDTLLLPWLVIAVSVWHSYVYGFVTLDAGAYALLAVAASAYLALAYVHRQQLLGLGKFKKMKYSEGLIALLHLVILGAIAGLAFI